MSDQSIFGEPGGAGRVIPASAMTRAKRPNPTHGLFGVKLIADAPAKSDEKKRLPRNLA